MILPKAPAKISDTEKMSTLGDSFRMMSYNQYPIPAIANNLKMVRNNFPADSEMGKISLSFVPHAAPSFSINKILNHEKTSTDSPKTKWVLMYILLI